MSELGVKIALATVSGAPHALENNVQDMLAKIRSANEAEAQLLLFPRESLMGATAGALYPNPMAHAVFDAVRRLARETGKCMTLFSFLMPSEEGPALAVCAAVNGKMRAVGFPNLTKQSLPPYLMAVKTNLGDDVALAGSANFPIPGTYKMVGVLPDRNPVAARHAMDIGAEIIAVMEAEATIASRDSALDLQRMSLALGCPCVSANAGPAESTQSAVYGGELAAAHSGRLLAHAPAFHEEHILLVDLPWQSDTVAPPAEPARDSRTPYAPAPGEHRAAWCAKAMEIAARGLAARLKRVQGRALVLGLSGGLDSTLALLVCRRALQINHLPPHALMAYSLPGPGTSERTLQNARSLLAALGLEHRQISITPGVSAHLQALGHDGRHDTAFENAQARERTNMLMNLCNMHDGLMVGPGDMSELALGFTTYNGDHMSMYGVNAGLYKSAIRLIVEQAALDAGGALGAALLAVLDTPISPELLPGGQAVQRTEDILGSYEVNDVILYHLLQGEDMPGILMHLENAFEGVKRESLGSALERFLQRFFAAQYKRSCMPDGPRILRHSLSPRGGAPLLPSDAVPDAWIQDIHRKG